MTGQIDMLSPVSLIAELCRVLDSSDVAMRCAMEHRQVTVSGHIVKVEHDLHWTQAQLSGRTAALHGRKARLFSAGVPLHHATQVDS